jgi:Domain of unknown function (DUF4194)
MATELPEFREWSMGAVRLLQGVVYADDGPVWPIVCSHRSRLDEYFARIGLALIVDEAEGFAFLRQLEEDESGPGYDALPKLFRKSRLSYDATVLCMLLRDELRRFEEEELESQRCVVKTSNLFELWKAFFPPSTDEVKLSKTLRTAMNDLEELKFIRRFTDEPEEWEIRRILKARTPVSTLELLLAQLRAAYERRTEKTVTQ